MKHANGSLAQPGAGQEPVRHNALPLGARADAGLTNEQLDTLRALAEYDLTRIGARLRDRGIMPASWVDEAVFEFRRYLGLKVIASRPIPMLSKTIDDVWHTCLVFTRLYADLCNRAFGAFVHHEPAEGPDPDPEASWQIFEQAYRRLYGKPGRLWLNRVAKP